MRTTSLFVKIPAAGRQVLENKPETAGQFVKSKVEDIHTYKTDNAFSFKVLRKYLNTDDPELEEEGYSFYGDASIAIFRELT
jgi:hypothetical protein